MLGTTCVTALLHFLSKLAIMPLNLFKLLFGYLCRPDITSFKHVRVQALAAIRGKRLVSFELYDREPDFFHLTNIPIANFVEVSKAHVVTVNVTDLLAANFDITAYVVLRLETVLAGLVVRLDLIGLIS